MATKSSGLARQTGHGKPRNSATAILDSPAVLRTLAFLAFASAWQLFATVNDSLFLPTFTDVAAALASMLSDGALWLAFGKSHVAMFLGYCVSVLLGVPLGLLLGRNRTAAQVGNPLLYALLATPLVGIIPLLTMSVGIGLLARVLLVWSFVFPVIVETTATGVRHVDRSLLDALRVFGASELQLWHKGVLPGAFDSIMTGLRLGAGRAIEGMVLVELIMVAVGIGGLILRYQAFFQSDRLYAVVVLVVLEALLVLRALEALQNYIGARRGRSA